MAKKKGVFGNTHETFLFNPPYGSVPINKIKPKALRKTVRIVNSFLTASFAKVAEYYNSRRSGSDDDDEQQQQQDDEEEEEEGSGNIFAMWVRHLFLNPGDPVCRENIWYFEHRVDMKKIGAVKTERIAPQHSVRASRASLFGMHLEPLYLLPAENLIINGSPSQRFRQDHALEQWWQPDPKLELKEFHWNDLS